MSVISFDDRICRLISVIAGLGKSLLLARYFLSHSINQNAKEKKNVYESYHCLKIQFRMKI